jgi:DNA-binding MarR family transcriptional regulator
VTGHDLALALRLAFLTLHRRTDAAMSAEGVTADQFVVLCALADSHVLTQRELVERTNSDPNTLRAMLVLLEQRELVERRANPDDARARSVSMTPKGRRMFQKLWSRSESVRQDMLRQLAADDVTTLVNLLHRLAAMNEVRPAAVSAKRPTRSRASTR